MGVGSTRRTRWKLIPSKQNDGQEERERVKEHVSEKDTSFLVFWSFGTHDSYRELGDGRVWFQWPLTCGEKIMIIKKFIHVAVWWKPSRYCNYRQLKIKLKKFVDGIL